MTSWPTTPHHPNSVTTIPVISQYRSENVGAGKRGAIRWSALVSTCAVEAPLRQWESLKTSAAGFNWGELVSRWNGSQQRHARQLKSGIGAERKIRGGRDAYKFVMEHEVLPPGILFLKRAAIQAIPAEMKHTTKPQGKLEKWVHAYVVEDFYELLLGSLILLLLFFANCQIIAYLLPPILVSTIRCDAGFALSLPHNDIFWL